MKRFIILSLVFFSFALNLKADIASLATLSAMEEAAYMSKKGLNDLRAFGSQKVQCENGHLGPSLIDPKGCPSIILDGVKNTLNGGVLEMFIGKTPWTSCRPENKMKSRFVKTAEEMDYYLHEQPESHFGFKIKDSLPGCLDTNNLNSLIASDKSKESIKKAIVGRFYHSGARLMNGQLENLHSIAAIDTLFGDFPLNDVECTKSSLAPRANRHCLKLKTCRPSENSIDSLVEQTKLGMKASSKLINELKKMNTFFKGVSEKNQKRYDDLKNKLELVMKINPWLRGEKFSNYKDSINDESSDKGKTQLIKKALKEQFKHIRSKFSNSLKKQKKAFLCLKGLETDCDKFDEVISKAPKLSKIHNNKEWADFFTKRKRQIRLELGSDFSHSVCMEEAKVNRDQFGDVMTDASIAAALSVTPFAFAQYGRLAISAGLSLNATNLGSNIIKAGVFLGNTSFAIDGTKDALEQCQGALYKLKGISPSSKDICPIASSANKITISRNLNNCLMASAMASIHYIPFASSFRLLKSNKKRVKKLKPQNKVLKKDRVDYYTIDEVQNFYLANSILKNRSLLKKELKIVTDPKEKKALLKSMAKIKKEIEGLIPNSKSRKRFAKYKEEVLDGPHREIVEQSMKTDPRIVKKSKSFVEKSDSNFSLKQYKSVSGKEKAYNYTTNLEKSDNILHISSSPENTKKISNKLLPYLKGRNIPHKVKADQNTYLQSLKDPSTQGKYITIYPRSVNEAKKLAKEMDNIIVENGLNNSFIKANGHSVGSSNLIYSKSNLSITAKNKMNGPKIDSSNSTSNLSDVVRTNSKGQAITKDGKLITNDGKPILINNEVELNSSIWKKLSQEGGFLSN